MVCLDHIFSLHIKISSRALLCEASNEMVVHCFGSKVSPHSRGNMWTFSVYLVISFNHKIKFLIWICFWSMTFLLLDLNLHLLDLQLQEKSMLKLDKICREANTMLVIARSYGLTGLVRISLKVMWCKYRAEALCAILVLVISLF